MDFRVSQFRDICPVFISAHNARVYQLQEIGCYWEIQTLCAPAITTYSTLRIGALSGKKKR